MDHTNDSSRSDMEDLIESSKMKLLDIIQSGMDSGHIDQKEQNRLIEYYDKHPGAFWYIAKNDEGFYSDIKDCIPDPVTHLIFGQNSNTNIHSFSGN
ncbi:hypothetical protein QLL95_gp0522 [Cotonvirus japonicus]|uniref:Uncharacterized protein n=1 Tax=Cotonvirus japonicus TaxID=2811091 RepID=A0ABM7NU62_9VIRU|nr:hypothetical protein QLL95_gp0522 [Cotonvirus japonicus]BCS83601.1 hypothetical protein [Cotonvirus japonicus]